MIARLLFWENCVVCKKIIWPFQQCEVRKGKFGDYCLCLRCHLIDLL